MTQVRKYKCNDCGYSTTFSKWFPITRCEKCGGRIKYIDI